LERVDGCRLSVVSFRLWVVGCRLSVVSFRLSVFTVTVLGFGYRLSQVLSQYSFRLWVFSCELSVVGFRLSQWLCLDLVIDYHGCYFNRYSLRFGCELSVFSCGLWVIGCYSDCAWIWLSVITGFISVFVSVVGYRLWVFRVTALGFGYWLSRVLFQSLFSSFRFSVIGCGVSVFGCGLSVLSFRLWVFSCELSVVGFHSDCAWIWLLIITGVISVFVSVVGFRLWGFSCELSVVGFQLSVFGLTVPEFGCHYSV
jgi:tyrosine kinase 3